MINSNEKINSLLLFFLSDSSFKKNTRIFFFFDFLKDVIKCEPLFFTIVATLSLSVLYWMSKTLKVLFSNSMRFSLQAFSKHSTVDMKCVKCDIPHFYIQLFNCTAVYWGANCLDLTWLLLGKKVVVLRHHCIRPCAVALITFIAIFEI